MAAEPSKATLTYSQEQVQQILNLAIAQQDYEGEFSHAQLLEIAEELAIPQITLEQAAQSIKTQQGELVKRQSFNLYRRANLRKKQDDMRSQMPLSSSSIPLWDSRPHGLCILP